MNRYDFSHGDRHLRNQVNVLAVREQSCSNVSKVVGGSFGYQMWKRM